VVIWSKPGAPVQRQLFLSMLNDRWLSFKYEKGPNNDVGSTMRWWAFPVTHRAGCSPRAGPSRVYLRPRDALEAGAEVRRESDERNLCSRC